MSIKGAEPSPSLDLFRKPPTDLSTVKYRYVKMPPQTSSITPIQVNVERQSDPIDLSRSLVHLDLGFKTTENANLTACANNVGMMTSSANNIAHTLFKQINFRANGTHKWTCTILKLSYRRSLIMTGMMERRYSNQLDGGTKLILL